MRRQYPSYRPSGVEWLGDVPDHWDMNRLRTTVTGCQNGVWGEEADEVHDVICVRVADFDRVELRVVLDTPTMRSIDLRSAQSHRLEKGDLLLEKSGGGEKQPVGVVVMYDHSEKAVCSNFVARISVAEGHHPRYLTYLHAAIYAARINTRSIKQNTGIQNLDSEGYLNEYAGLPPLDEQCEIAEYLDRETERIDALVAKMRLLIERLKEHRTALITRIVTRGLPPGAARAAGLDPAPRLKPSGVEWLGEVPEHWELKRIAAAARPGPDSFTDGDWVELPYITDNGVRLIQTGNIGIGEYREQGHRYIDESSFEELRCTDINPGDVLICRLAEPVGRACLAPDLGVRMITSVDVCILKASEQFSGSYLVFLMSSRRYLDYVESLVRGGTRNRISRQMLGAIKIPAPPEAEQRAIAAYLEQVTSESDNSANTISKAIERLEEYRSALITAAVTGKVDVREPVAV